MKFHEDMNQLVSDVTIYVEGLLNLALVDKEGIPLLYVIKAGDRKFDVIHGLVSIVYDADSFTDDPFGFIDSDDVTRRVKEVTGKEVHEHRVIILDCTDIVNTMGIEYMGIGDIHALLVGNEPFIRLSLR